MDGVTMARTAEREHAYRGALAVPWPTYITLEPIGLVQRNNGFSPSVHSANVTVIVLAPMSLTYVTSRVSI